MLEVTDGICRTRLGAHRTAGIDVNNGADWQAHRRIRNRTYGGVGGRGRWLPLPPDFASIPLRRGNAVSASCAS